MKHVIDKEGVVFVSIDMLMSMMDKMVETRNAMVAEDPDNEILVPGSDAALGTLGHMLLNMRFKHIAEADLSDEVNEMFTGLSEFLDEQ